MTQSPYQIAILTPNLNPDLNPELNPNLNPELNPNLNPDLIVRRVEGLRSRRRRDRKSEKKGRSRNWRHVPRKQKRGKNDSK